MGAAFFIDPVLSMLRGFERHGRLVALEMPFSALHLLVVGSKYNEHILKNPELFHADGILLPGPKGSAQRRIRSSIFQMNGLQHTYYRKLLTPPLSRARLDTMVTHIAGQVEEEIASWPQGKVADLWPLCQRLTQRIAITSLFDGLAAEDFSDTSALAREFNNHSRINSSLAVLACPVDIPVLPYRRLLRNAERLETRILAWTKKQLGKPRPSNLASVVCNARDENGNALTDEKLVGHLMTMMGATFETCQTALSWTLFLLAQHPVAARELLDEIDNPCLRNRSLEEQLDHCSMLDRVTKESLRILPPVPYQSRISVRDSEFDGLRIPKRTKIILSSFLTNRVPELYPEANRFRPARWKEIDPSQYEYFVFGGGPRLCVGYRFALMVLKIMILQIVRRYRVTVVDGARIDHKVSVSMWPKRGIPVSIHAQDGRFSATAVRGTITKLVRLDQP